jgi:hypothetical protein
MIARKTLLAAGTAASLTLIGYSALSQAKNPQKPVLKTDPSVVSKQTDKKQADTGQGASKDKFLSITAEESVDNEATKTLDAKNAVVTDMEEGTVFKADLIHVNNKKGVQTANATGNMSVTDKQADVTGEKAVVYFARSKRLAVVTGNVVILVKPKKDDAQPAAPAAPSTGPAPVSFQNGKPTVEPKTGQEDESASDARKHPSTITCDKLEYEYAKSKKHAILTGHFKVVQKLSDRTRTLTADHADWYGLEDRLVLHPPVLSEDTKGQSGSSKEDDVIVFTKEGSEGVIMKKGTAIIKVDEDQDDTATPPKPDNPADKKQPPEKKPATEKITQ